LSRSPHPQGFIDPHLHLIPGGLSLHAINLRAARSKQHFQQLIADAAAAAPDREEWLVGFGWDEATWGGDPPDASWIDGALDAATPQQEHKQQVEDADSPNSGGSSSRSGRQRPAFMVRMDGHMAVANRAALEVAGVIADTPDPEHGAIGRAVDGTPTGVLRWVSGADSVGPCIKNGDWGMQEAAIMQASNGLL
jgi:predicted amidohydrolase YtcJ